MANIETGVMQGDPTPILIANAYAFGARNYDPKPIFEIMRKGAEEPGSKSQDIETRPGLRQYLDKDTIMPLSNWNILLPILPSDGLPCML